MKVMLVVVVAVDAPAQKKVLTRNDCSQPGDLPNNNFLICKQPAPQHTQTPISTGLPKARTKPSLLQLSKT